MKPRSLQSTSVIPAVVGMMSLLLLNMGVFSGGARMQSDRMTKILDVAALSEVILSVEREVADANRLLALTSDDLLGRRTADERREFQTAFEARISTIRGLADEVSRASLALEVEDGVQVAERIDVLLDSWTSFSAFLSDDLTKATMELILGSDPVAAELLGSQIPDLLQTIIESRVSAQAEYERIAGISQIILSIVFLSSLFAVVILLSHIFKAQGIRDQLEADLRSTMRQAQQAALAKSRFLSNMSHELRTPMNGVIGMANLLALRKVPEEEKRMIRVLKESADAALGLINDILDFEEIEAQKVVLQTRMFRLEDALGSIAAQAEELLEDKPVAFSIIREDSLPQELEGDDERLVQVVMNLVSNGIKFTESGFVRLSVGWDASEGLTLAVQDSGMGIHKKDVKGLFEAFRQVDDSGHRRFGGTGLGLAITSQLVELMDGRISVDSKVGEGSTFTVVVPLFPPKAEPSSKAMQTTDPVLAPVQAESAGQPVVLCVQENEINLEIARYVVEEAGYACFTATRGEDAIQIAQEEPVTLVLMECHLPDMDCRKAAKAMRQHRPGLPIYGLAEKEKAAEVTSYGQWGMQGVVAKPLTSDAVTAIVTKVHNVDERAPQSQSARRARQGEVSAVGV